MDPELWQRVKPLFLEARTLDPDRRDAYLQRRCGQDAALRRELEALLAGDREAPDEFLDPPAASSRTGERVGAYEIRRLLGEGGMGEVYLAQRADDEFRKRVALKLLRPGMASQEVVRRFRTERQILAGLDHPAIAKLLDGGTTGDGLPYIVMEYVEGQPIDRYCDARKLPVSERLELFCEVCEAVHFAHQNLVVHRDLKPGNILITARGAPKLLDFGIAKLLNPELAPDQVAATVWGRPMTPDYASPEQVRGEPITTATDVYSLGVLLYLLLTGHLPYRIAGRTPGEAERVVCETEPERPSTAVLRSEQVSRPDGTTGVLTPESVSRVRSSDPARLRRRLAGDLDNVLAKALHKEPQRRYRSAEQLAADLRHHLRGRPVMAAGDSLVYRCRKFVRRHRAGVTAALTMAIAVVAFGVAMAVQGARLQKALAREEFVTRVLSDLFEVSDPFSDELDVRAILDRAADRLGSELAAQPEVRARLLSTAGTIYRNLADFGRAGPLLEQALELRQERWGEDHPDVTASLDALGLLRQAEGRYEDAEELFRRALEIRRRLPSPSPELADSLQHLAVVLQERNRHDEAESLLREALALRRRLLGDHHPDVGETLSDLARTLRSRGELEQAETYLLEALEIFRRHYGPDHPHTAEVLNNLAFFARERGELDAAEGYFRQVLEIFRQRLGDHHPHVATALHNLAGVLHDRGDDAQAEEAYRRALAIRRARLGVHPDVANTLYKLADLLRSQKRFEEALPYSLEAAEVLDRTLGVEHPYTLKLREQLTELCEALGRDGCDRAGK